MALNLKEQFPSKLPKAAVKRYKALGEWEKLNYALATRIMANLGVVKPSEISETDDDDQRDNRFDAAKANNKL